MWTPHSVLAPTRRSSNDRAGGYTAIEILLAMTVMAIGAAAVMSMQKATMKGNLDARKMDVANSIARTWVERLERDAMQWTLPGASNPGAASNLSNAKLISGFVDTGWFVPVNQMGGVGTPPETTSYGFDILGRDLASSDIPSSAVFCVNMRLTTLVANQFYRADVRVLWLEKLGTSGANPSPFCSSTNADMTALDPNATSNVSPSSPRYHAIYTTTAIRENP